MLMFHDGRMGFAGAAGNLCRAPSWPAPPLHWFAPYPSPAMNDVLDRMQPASPQSDTDSSHSSSSDSSRITFAQSPSDTIILQDSVGKGQDPAQQQLLCRWDQCQEVLPSLDSLSSHVSAAHAHARDGLFYCGWKDCPRGHRGFNARYKMLVHVRTHTNERPHRCGLCAKSFSRAENLKIHSRSHSGEKPYVCPVEGCNKAYSNSSDRFKHTRTHSVDKPYCCKIPGCQKRYTDPSSLRKHVKTYKHPSLPSPSVENELEIKMALEKRIADTEINAESQYKVKYFKQDKTSLSDGDAYEDAKIYQRKYSLSENDGHKYEDNFRETSDIFEMNNTEEDIDKLCFCKNLPCVHTNRYVTPDYVQKGTPLFEFCAKSEDRRVPERYREPFNLKRRSDNSCYVYENGVLNLEKKSKPEEYNVEICIDTPLDLSNKKFY